MPPAWQALAAHHEQVKHLHLRRIFSDDPARGERMTGDRGRPLPGLLEESRHGRDSPAPRAAGRGRRTVLGPVMAYEALRDDDQLAERARAGLGGDVKAVAKHCVAVSTNAAEVARFGIDTATAPFDRNLPVLLDKYPSARAAGRGVRAGDPTAARA
jgi:Phosphoglucose isomerase